MAVQHDTETSDMTAKAWKRYRRLMVWMTLFTLVCVAVSFWFLYWSNGFVSIHMFIATAAGVGFSVLLAAALMGLVFVSSNSGHDEAVKDQLEKGDTEDE